VKSMRFFAVFLFALLLALFPFLGAAAGAQWCDTDPPVKLALDVAGHYQDAHLTIGVAGVEHQAALGSVTVGSSVSYTKVGVSTSLMVTVPGDGFAVRAILSSGENGAGVVYDYAEGLAGQPLTVTFTSLKKPASWNAGYSSTYDGSGCSYSSGNCQMTFCGDFSPYSAGYTYTNFYTHQGGVAGYKHFEGYAVNGCGGSNQVTTYIRWDESVDIITIQSNSGSLCCMRVYVYW
jgi:hypothetical protein